MKKVISLILSSTLIIGYVGVGASAAKNQVSQQLVINQTVPNVQSPKYIETQFLKHLGANNAAYFLENTADLTALPKSAIGTIFKNVSEWGSKLTVVLSTFTCLKAQTILNNK